MSWYIIVDIVFVGLVIYFAKIAFEKKYYVKFFEYFKIFVAIFIASKLAPYTGMTLQKLFIIKSDTYITLLIIAFSVNFFLIYYFWKSFVKAFNNFISTSKLKNISAKVLSLLEAVLLFTFVLYMTMQIYIIKINLEPTLNKTYTYKIVKSFYHKFLNEDILAILQGSNTGTNTHEVIFKSFTNSM